MIHSMIASYDNVSWLNIYFEMLLHLSQKLIHGDGKILIRQPKNVLFAK